MAGMLLDTRYTVDVTSHSTINKNQLYDFRAADVVRIATNNPGGVYGGDFPATAKWSPTCDDEKRCEG